MKIRIRSPRKARAITSAMEFWPAGNYVEYMPKGTGEQRLGQYWLNTGNQLKKSIKTYEQARHD